MQEAVNDNGLQVQVFIELRKLSVDGVRQKGELLFATREGAIELTMGDDNVPSGSTTGGYLLM